MSIPYNKTLKLKLYYIFLHLSLYLYLKVVQKYELSGFCPFLSGACHYGLN